MQGLVDDYDSIAEVPIDQLSQMTALQTAMMSSEPRSMHGVVPQT